MAGLRCTDLQSRPMEFLDFTSLTLDEFQQLVRPSRPRSTPGWRHGRWMGNRGPRAGLPSTKTARSRHRKTGSCYLGLPQNLRPPGGARALIRPGPGQSQSVDPRPVAALLAALRALGDAPARSLSPWPSASVSQRPTPLPWSSRWRRSPPLCLPSQPPRRPPPFAHDGTERRIVRPQDPPAQTDCYSGKKKDHTVKNVLLVNALLIILFLSDTYGAASMISRLPRPHPIPACGSRLLQDLGFLAFTLPRWRSSCRPRNPRPGTHPGTATGQPGLHYRRLRIEHVNRSVKRCRIVKTGSGCGRRASAIW